MSQQELNSILGNLAAVAQDIDNALDHAVNVTAIQTRTRAINSIKEVSEGERVRRYHKGEKPKDHVVSKEGEAPNTDTGQLIGSIKSKHEKGFKVAHTYSDVEHAIHLELVNNRPFLKPAADAEHRNFIKRVKNNVKKALK